MSFQSCLVTKQSTSTADSTNENKPQILFLNCLAKNDSLKQEQEISLINMIITEGKIKAEVNNSKIDKEGGFSYSLLSIDKQVISQTYIANPLNKTIEYVDNNGHLMKKDIRLDRAEFSLRIPLITDAKYLSFEKRNKQLLLINLRK